MRQARNARKYNNFWVVMRQARSRVGVFNFWYSEMTFIISCTAHTRATSRNPPPIPVHVHTLHQYCIYKCLMMSVTCMIWKVGSVTYVPRVTDLTQTGAIEAVSPPGTVVSATPAKPRHQQQLSYHYTPAIHQCATITIYVYLYMYVCI